MGFFKANSLTVFLSFSKGFILNYLRTNLFFEIMNEKKDTKNISFFGLLFISSFLNRALFYPIDRIRTLIITETAKNTLKENYLVSAYFRKFIQKEPFLKICKGFNFSLLSTIPETFIIFALFFGSKDLLQMDYLSSAILACGLGHILLYPFDTVLKRYQSDSLVKAPKYLYNGVSHLIKNIYNKEGVSGFYRGYFVHSLHNAISLYLFVKVFQKVYYRDINTL